MPRIEYSRSIMFSRILNNLHLNLHNVSKYRYVLHIEKPSYEIHFYPLLRKFDPNEVLVLTEYPLSNTKINTKNIRSVNSVQLALIYKFSKANFIFTSTPGLDNHHLKKKSSPEVKYIFVHHSPISHHFGYREKDFVHFDFVLCFTKIQMEEISKISKAHKNKITGLPYEYSKINKEKKRIQPFTKSSIIIAPTWGKMSLLYSSDLIEIIHLLLNNNYSVTLSPHPESLKQDAKALKKIKKSLKDLNGFTIDLKGAIKKNISSYQYMLSDTSGACIDFYLITNRKGIVFTEYKKCRNKNFKKICENVTEVNYTTEYAYTIDTQPMDNLLEALNKNNEKENMGFEQYVVLDAHHSESSINKLINSNDQ